MGQSVSEGVKKDTHTANLSKAKVEALIDEIMMQLEKMEEQMKISCNQG